MSTTSVVADRKETTVEVDIARSHSYTHGTHRLTAPSPMPPSSVCLSFSSRASLGGRFAPVTKSNSRASLAPQSTSRQSIGGRQSLAPSRQSLAPSASGSSSSRQSIGGGRNSLGSRNALIDRKSGGRRSSGAGNRGVRTDPRPISTKEFVKDNIRKLILFLTSGNYDHPVSLQQLQTPSTKDFKNIITFLFQKLDTNFEFPATAFEDSVKMYMKRFGYPFAISKNALQAAGTRHTWPSLLAMLVWFQEFLQYHDAVHGAAAPLGTESEQKMFFEYASGAYLAFLQGEDNFTLFDETLAKKFEYKNQVVSEDVRKFQQRIADATADIKIYQEAADRLVEYQTFVRAAHSDIPALEENIKQNRDHMKLVLTKKNAREAELESKRQQLAACREEHALLSSTLAAQPFTPLQVKEMLFQKSTLEDKLSEQRSQAQTTQNETFKVELEVARTTANIEKLLNELNEVSMEVSSVSQRSTIPFEHVDARFLPMGDKVENMLSLNLKVHKEIVSTARDGVIAAKRELTLESKKKDAQLSQLAECQNERQGAVDVLSKRLVKLTDAYTSERATMRRTVEASCAEVEDVELDIVRLRNALTAGVEKVPSSALAAMDAEIQHLESTFLLEESTLKGEICSMMQELTEHKVAVQERLEQMLEQAEAIRSDMAATQIQQAKME